MKALTVAQVVAGEAVSGTYEERMADMKAVASAIRNRADLLGVSMDDIIAAPTKYGFEFNAYNKNLPAGVDQDIIDMAQQALDEVMETGPVHNGTFFATPETVGNLPDDLSFETSTTGHEYFSDPFGRAIGTAKGYITPNKYSFAQNLPIESIPTPSSATASADPWSEMAAAPPMQAMQRTPGEWGLNWDVAPALTPTVEGWSEMAAAEPVQAPVEQRQMAGFLNAPADLSSFAEGLTASREVAAPREPVPTINSFADLAGAGPFGGDFASAAERMGVADQEFDQARFDGLPSRISDAAQKSARIGQTETASASSFDPSRFDGLGVSVANDFDAGRFSPSSTVAFDAARMPGLIDPRTNVTGFLDAPPADVAAANGFDSSRFASLPTTNFDPARFSGPTINPMTNTQVFSDQPSETAGFLSAQTETSPGMGFLSQPTTDNTVTGSTTPGLLSATSIASANAPLSFTPSSGILGAQPVQQNAFVDSFPSAVANNTIEPAAVNDVVAAPTLDSIQISEQPTVAATVEGPATTDAVEQQATQTTAKAPTTVARTTPTVSLARPSFADKVKGFLNPGTSIGATIGGFLGLPGAAIGGFLGNAAYQGLQSPSQPMSINNIGSGYDNVTSIWDGGQPPGTQATASDGQTVTAMSGGRTAITGKSGVVTVFDSSGKAMSYFGNDLDQDQDTEGASSTGGGLFSGQLG